MNTNPPAYVLGGHEAGLAVIRSLGRAGLPVVSVVSSPREHGGRSRYATSRATAPDPADRTRDYIEFLLGLGDEYGDGILVPTTDESVEAVSTHREELAARHRLACPSLWAAEHFLDKRLTSEVAGAAGVEAPATSCPDTPEELERCACDLRFPCLIKPRESYRYTRAFGVKMTRVEDRDELRAAWRAAHDAGIGVLVQEIIPGPETGGVNYNLYMVDGEPAVEFTSRKVRLSPPDFGFPCVVRSAPVPEVVEPGRRIARALGVQGFANVEFKQDERDGRYKLMEVNGRPNMSGELAIRCGVDFPLMTYRHLVHGVVPAPASCPRDVYWIHEVADPGILFSRWRRGQLALRQALVPYLSRHVFASFALRDPGPFVDRARAKAFGVSEVVESRGTGRRRSPLRAGAR